MNILRLIITGCLFLVPTVIFAQAPPVLSTNADALVKAAETGDLNQVQTLVDLGTPVDQQTGKYGETALTKAAGNGHLDILNYLLSKGAKPDVPSKDGATPLVYACYKDQTNCALKLLDAGANVDFSMNNGRTPLMYAANKGNDRVVAALIAHHAKLDVFTPPTSSCAIMWAINPDHTSTVKLLLEAGAQINPLPAAPDPHRPPIIAIAAWRDDLAMIDLFLAHGADINAIGENGMSVIGAAVGGSKPETIIHLLDKGADPNRLDNHGLSGLMYAANYKDALTILPSFLDHGAKIETKDSKGATALMWASRHDNEDAVRFFLDHGADINATDASGETALTYAADRGHSGIVQLLKDKGATRTDIHVIARDKPPTTLPPERTWAIAVGAIYPQMNGLNPQILGYGDDDHNPRELQRDWNITDRNSFLKVINSLLSNERRTGLQSKGAQLAAMPDAQFAASMALVPADEATHVKGLRNGYIKWKDRVGLAWDLCRAANLINVGFDMHYIDEQEAWGFLQTIANETQAHFTSWQEMSDNYLDGREGWYGVREPRYDACAQLMLNPKDPNSPWNQNPWKTPLPSNNEPSSSSPQ